VILGERVWEKVEIIEIKDGKLKTTLDTQGLKYNKYYLGIRIDQDPEMVPRKPIIVGSEEYKRQQEKKLIELEENRKRDVELVKGNFTNQEDINKTIEEILVKLRTGDQPGDIPVLNSEGKIDRSLLDLPTPSAGGGLREITLNH